MSMVFIRPNLVGTQLLSRALSIVVAI